MPRLTIEQLSKKEHSGEWGGKDYPKTLWCPDCKGVMKIDKVDRTFISGDGIYYKCNNGVCGYTYRTIGNAPRDS